MKKKLLFGLCCIALIGCTTDIDDMNSVVIDGAPQIKISGHIDQDYVSRVNDGGFCTGDQIGLFGVNYTNNNTLAGTLLDKGNQVDNARYTFNAEEWTWTSSGGVYYKDSKTNIDLYGYYPYANVESVNAYTFEVQRDQSGENSVDGYGLSDFLWGKATNITPSDAKVKITFNHKLSCANVILVEDEGFADGEFEALKKSVLVMNTSRKAEIDLATGVPSAVGEVESEGIVMKSNNEGYRAIVVPQTVEAGASLFSITVDGVAYRFKYQQGTSPFTFESGKQAKFTISIKKKVPSGDYEFTLTDCDIVDWIADIDTHGGEARQYYIVHQEEPGTLSAKLREAKKDPTKIKNLKISGKIDVCDFYFMRDSMDLLQAVNLKESTIEGAWECYAPIKGVKTYFYLGGIPKTATDGEVIAAFRKAYPEISSYYYVDYACLANEIPHNAFAYKSYLTYFSFPEKIVKIRENAFANCSLLSGALIIPNSVVEIGDSAFSWCSNLTSLQLPYGLKTLGKSTFSNCSTLSGELLLPESVINIGAGCFANCDSFTGNLSLPSFVTIIPEGCFSGCSGLTGNIEIPDGVTSIEGSAFSGCYGLNGTLTLPNSITSIGYGAFSSCNLQGELNLPINLRYIPAYCFCETAFSSIANFPDGLLEIGSCAFGNCWRLSGILEFPESLVSIEDRAFAGCSTLEGIVLPQELVSIKNASFGGCYYISKIVCKAEEPPIIQGGAFDGVAKDNFALEVPEKSIIRYQNDANWGEF